MSDHLFTPPPKLPADRFRLLDVGEVVRHDDRIWVPGIERIENAQGAWAFPAVGITVTPGLVIRRELDAVSRLGRLHEGSTSPARSIGRDQRDG